MAEKVKHFSGNSNSKCILCNSEEENEKLLGSVYVYNSHPYYFYVHFFCLRFASGLIQNADDEYGIIGYLPIDILKEVKRAKRLKCSFCKKKGASIGCAIKTCSKKYHYPCALKENVFAIFCKSFSLHCEKHKKLPYVPPNNNSMDECKICLFEIISQPSWDNIFAYCCNTWLHRDCVLDYAYTMKNQLKCPICRNVHKFQAQVREWGIDVSHEYPEWISELEQEAIVEISCAAQENCRCEHGVEFHVEKTEYEIILCDNCGYDGIHVKCGNLKENDKWICRICSSITIKLCSRITLNESKSEEALSPLTSFTKTIKKQDLVTKIRPSMKHQLRFRDFKIVIPRRDKIDLKSLINN